MTNAKKLSSKRITWIKEQGYFRYTDEQIQAWAFGNRFAYRLCTALLLVGVLLQNIPLLVLMNAVAFASIFLPNHPFDYIYNYGVRKWTKGPKLPKRSIQLKFACTMASLFIASTIFFFLKGMITAGYIMGLHIVVVASLVSLFDFCIPSKIFNYFTGR